jgi:hypothetical protein
MAKKNIKEMSFLDHLEELRWLLVRSTIAILVCAVVAFFFSDFIFNEIIFGPKSPDFITYRLFCELSQQFGLDKSLCVSEINLPIQNREMGGQFSMHMWTSITVGFIFSFPFILWEIWKFIRRVNKYVNDKEPWKNEENRNIVLYNLLEALRVISILIWPFIPETSEKINRVYNEPELKNSDYLPKLKVASVDIEADRNTRKLITNLYGF